MSKNLDLNFEQWKATKERPEYKRRAPVQSTGPDAAQRLRAAVMAHEAVCIVVWTFAACYSPAPRHKTTAVPPA